MAVLVSVLIPCFNAERYVAETIKSVLAQTYKDIEVIVADDRSTDTSYHIVASYSRFRVQLHLANGGCAAAARNLALSKATGAFVLFLDADDLIAADHVERLVTRLTAASPNHVAMGEWDRFQSDTSEASFPTRAGNRDAHPIDWIVEDWVHGSPMTQCGAFLIPRALLDHAGGWDERLTLIDDFEFFARVLTHASGITFVPGARLYYRSGVRDSLSARTSRSAAESAALALRVGTDHLLAAEKSQRTCRAAANMLRTFDHTFYPAFSDLGRSLEARILELGGSDLQPVGPPGFHRLRRWIGWRAARRVQHLAARLGWNHASRRRAKLQKAVA